MDEVVELEAGLTRVEADMASASLKSYGLRSTVTADPVAVHGYAGLRAPLADKRPVFSLHVRRDEAALARDILRRDRENLPEEFTGDEIEQWSAHRRAQRLDGTGWRRGIVVTMIWIAFLIVIAVLVGGLLTR